MYGFFLATLVAVFPPPGAPVVHIADFVYKPASITITVGQEITFVNDDAEPHTVTSTANTFDSGGLDTKQSWKHRFTRVGTFAYRCELHPQMLGTIVVRKAVTVRT